MATNYIRDGKTTEFVAPVGGVTSGVPITIQQTLCLPITTALVGVTFSAYTSGVWDMPKAAGTTATAGAPAYWDQVAGQIEAADAADNRLVGYFAEAALNGPLVCRVNVVSAVAADSNADLASKANKTAAALGQIATLSAAGDLVASGTLLADVPTMAANGGVGTLVGTAAASKALSNSGVVIANVVTQVADAAGAGTVPIYAGATKVLQDSVVALSALQLAAKLTSQDIVIALGSATTTTAANPAWVGATILAWSPISGNDQIPVGASVAGDGAVTITVAVVETAAATFRVFARLA